MTGLARNGTRSRETAWGIGKRFPSDEVPLSQGNGKAKKSRGSYHVTVRQRGWEWGVNPCEDRDVGEVTRYCRGVARSASDMVDRDRRALSQYCVYLFRCQTSNYNY